MLGQQCWAEVMCDFPSRVMKGDAAPVLFMETFALVGQSCHARAATMRPPRCKKAKPRPWKSTHAGCLSEMCGPIVDARRYLSLANANCFGDSLLLNAKGRRFGKRVLFAIHHRILGIG